VSSILNIATDAGRALLDQITTQQAAIIAYANDFKLLMYLTLATIPFLVLIGSAGLRRRASSSAAAFE